MSQEIDLDNAYMKHWHDVYEAYFAARAFCIQVERVMFDKQGPRDIYDHHVDSALALAKSAREYLEALQADPESKGDEEAPAGLPWVTYVD